MKTVAISIDEPTIQAIDELVQHHHHGSRSSLIRQALQRFVESESRSLREEGERLALRRHRELLRRQAAALVDDQEKP